MKKLTVLFVLSALLATGCSDKNENNTLSEMPKTETVYEMSIPEAKETTAEEKDTDDTTDTEITATTAVTVKTEENINQEPFTPEDDNTVKTENHQEDEYNTSVQEIQNSEREDIFIDIPVTTDNVNENNVPVISTAQNNQDNTVTTTVTTIIIEDSPIVTEAVIELPFIPAS